MATAISANKAELLAIADAVAREKLIDREIVIEAMEDAIQRAARARYGAENDIRAKIDTARAAICACGASSRSSRTVEDYFKQAPSSTRRSCRRRRRRRLHRRSAAELRIRPHRRAGGQAGDLPEGPRCRARPPV